MLIGAKLKVIRKSKGLSLRALSEQCDVTVGALSQIENDNTSPSISTLKRILKALGSSMGDFFQTVEKQEADQIVFRPEELIDASPVKGVALLGLPKIARDQGIQLLCETYQPGASTGPDYYSHEGEECGVCLEGRVELRVNGNSFILEPGDVYAFNSTLQHCFTNIGPEAARIVSACTPSSF
jgi:transcriptional regulator with XRE-family HTH domain